MELLSIVVPCYNEQETVALFYDATIKVLNEMDVAHEIIYVNDGSRDNTMEALKDLYTKHPEDVKVIDFSRNFGKEGGLLAGLEYAKGDYIVVMDADLQDPPSFLPEMLRIIRSGDVDIVGTRRVTRKGEPPIRSFFARAFYRLINHFTEVEIVDGARDFRMMRKPVVDSILELQEYHRFSKGLFAWVGYKTIYLEYENVERVAGETSWSFWKLVKYAIEGIVAFTTAPLQLATVFGVLFSGVAFLALLFVVIRALLFGDPVAGWPSMVAIILFLGGIQLLSLGIIGEYLSKTYMEVKNRPKYIVRKFYSKEEA